MGVTYGKTKTSSIVTSGLVLNLDAGNPSSYPGSGTVWYDLSGNGYNYNIVATAYDSSGPKYMNFNGSHGIAKRGSDFTLSGNVTILTWTRIKETLGDWRTLTRAYGGDHIPIVAFDSYNFGMYDNDSGGFITCNCFQDQFPTFSSNNWLFLHIRMSSSSPFMRVSYNNYPEIIFGQTTNSNAALQRGPGNIGGYHNESTNPSIASQYWGDIASIKIYNRILTNKEISQNYSVEYSRFYSQ